MGLRASAIAGAFLAAVFSGRAGAQETPEPTPAQTAAPVARKAPPTERVTITGSIPVPIVGEGAPYHSVGEIKAIGQAAQQDYVHATRDTRIALGSATCRDPKETSVFHRPPPPTMATAGKHDPGAPPTLQALEMQVKTASRHVTEQAARAEDATRKADESRVKAAAGDLDMKSVEKIELQRQAVVKQLEKARLNLMEAQAAVADFAELKMQTTTRITGARAPLQIDWLDIDMRAAQRRRAGWGLGLPKGAPPKGLSIGAMDATERQDERGLYLRVVAQVVNAGEKPTTLPDMLISLLDERGLVLRTATASTDGKRQVPPNGALAFQYDMRPSPEHVSQLVINFSSGLEPPPTLPLGMLCDQDAPE